MTQSSDRLSIYLLGGAGEIGMNLMLLEADEDAVVIDAGSMFPRGGEAGRESVLGFECLIPDLSILRRKRPKIRAILLTHAHEDHIGALPHILSLLDVPVYGAPFTLALVHHRLAGFPAIRAQLQPVRNEDAFSIGSFSVRFLPTSHSIPGSRAIYIETPAARILHTGDFKLDSSTGVESRFEVATFQRICRPPIDLLISESTNVLREGRAPTEEEACQSLRRIAEGASGRLVVSTFASHIQRVQQCLLLASETERKLAFSGASLHAISHIARDLGLLTIPPGVVLDEDNLSSLPLDRQMLLITGSQGEPRSALRKLATDQHPHLRVEKNDTILLAARLIPGNEMGVFQMVNALERRGAHVFYGDYSDLESSGHAYAEELQDIIKILQPKWHLPIHGEYRHLRAHQELARRAGLSAEKALLGENGDVFHFSQGNLIGRTQEPIGRLAARGPHLDRPDGLSAKQRRDLARGGVVSVLLALESSTSRIRIREVRGLGIRDDWTDSDLREAIQKEILESTQPVSGPVKTLEEAIPFVEQCTRRVVRRTTGHKPHVLVHGSLE